MRVSGPFPILLAVIVFLLSGSLASAGFLDSIINQAKQAAEAVVNPSIDPADEAKSDEKPQSTQQDTPTQEAASPYDPTLVKQIQQGLNRLGYGAGRVDGLYGPGTRKSIEAFQRKENLAVDGAPSEALLVKITATQSEASNSQKATPATNLPEPTPGAFMLAAVHFRPYLLDDDFMLQRVLLTVHPETQPVVSNEFQWHKRKDELKNQLLTEAKSPQLAFELQPWRDSSMAKARPVELVKYDSKRQAFLVKFAVGTARQVTPKMLISSSGEPASKYPDMVNWFFIDPDKAEEIANYFGKQKRQVYLHYRLNAVGIGSNASQPTPIVEFENDQLELYALEATPQGNQMHTEFKYLTRVMLPRTDTPAPKPVVKNNVAANSDNPAGVIRNVEIDGVKLGMPIDEALKKLKKQGYKMKPPSQNSKLTGVTIEGRGSTDDGSGLIKIMIRHMNGIVYQYDKNVTYLLNRMPVGSSVSSLQEKYQAEFVKKFTGVRYEETAANGIRHFDDGSPPPYNRKISTPHARVTLVAAESAGRFVANIGVEWKSLVGASW
jgi:hypothetical protein